MAAGAIGFHHGPDLSRKCNRSCITSIEAGIVFCSLHDPVTDQLNLFGIQWIVWWGWHQVIIVVSEDFEELTIVWIPGFDPPCFDNGSVIGKDDTVFVRSLVMASRRCTGRYHQGKNGILEVYCIRITGTGRDRFDYQIRFRSLFPGDLIFST